MLAGSDAVAVLPRRIARELAGYRPLVARDLPFDSPSIEFDSPSIETVMIWPRWLENDPAHRWLRDAMRRAVSDLPNS